jgi:hypothetical protein
MPALTQMNCRAQDRMQRGIQMHVAAAAAAAVAVAAADVAAADVA